jgi:serine/threonine protein kinase
MRTLSFCTENERDTWYSHLQIACGQKNLMDFYEIGNVIGKGGFGCVYAATHKLNLKKYAIKVLKKKNLKADRMLMCRREIDSLKMCKHPNIIQLVEILESFEFIFIVLELMEGGDLKQYL